MPDRRAGFVRRGKGILAPNEVLADEYRDRAAQEAVLFDSRVELLLIEESRVAFEKQRCRGHFVATEPTHVHILVSWPDERAWQRMSVGLKQSLTRRLNHNAGPRQWFVEGSSRKRVMDREHFDYLVNKYLPRHGGWKWCEGGEPYR
jgi:REP element-mobilizing transposase RayT